MARITSYSLDQALTTDDKVVGTDALTGTVRNYTVGDLSGFINTANLGNYTFDTTQTPGSGTDNFVLTYDNSTGKISLEAASGGGGGASGVTSVTGSAPVVSSGGTTPAISMAAATTSVNGYLTSTDWNTFNGKQGSITLTTTGTSGAATLVGTPLNIPQYSGGGGGGLSNVVEDTTPQLGGNLDANGNDIDMGTNNITDAKVGQWDTAYGWGNHSTQGYLTSYTEADTLNSVVGRGAVTTTTAVIPFYYANQAAFPNATTYHGAIAHSHADGAMYFAHSSAWVKLANDSDLANKSNWDTAYGWGDHSSAGYVTATILAGNLTGTVNSVAVATVTSGAALGATAQQPPSEGAFVNGDKTKLDAIEASADVTDTANVTSAGALMDSEVTNLAQVKAFSSADYATAAQGTTANAALPKAGGAMSGAITGNQEITGRRPIVADTNTTINLTLGTHEGVFLYSDNGSAVTLNVPANSSQAFPVGTEIDIIQAGAGVVSLTPAGGVNLNGANTAIPITAQWGAVTIKQIVADNWIVVGKI